LNQVRLAIGGPTMPLSFSAIDDKIMSIAAFNQGMIDAASQKSAILRERKLPNI